MSDVTLLGLGPMGSALAQALINGHLAVTLWNRSADRALPFTAQGARLAASLAVAIAASPVTLVCLDSYATTRALFEAPALAGLLPGRVIVQLSTGTPSEARAASRWFTAAGARYLDGAILCGVPSIGTPKGLLVYSGDEAAFQASLAVLAPLGAPPRFTGADPGVASVLDMAWLIRIAADYLAIYQGAATCRAEGVGIDQLVQVFPGDAGAAAMLDPILRNDFGKATANVAVWNKAAKHIALHAREAGITSALPDLVVDTLNRTEAAGFGAERMAAIVKILGRPGDFGPEA